MRNNNSDDCVYWFCFVKFVLKCRPHVVGVQWLIDCLKQGCRLNEVNYKCVELPLLKSVSPHNQNRK